MTRRSRLALILTLILTPTIVAACSSSPSSPSASSHTVRTNPPTTVAEPIASATVTINGKTYSVPQEVAGTPITPTNDTGQQVVYTSSGFLPRTLYSASQTPVVWTNLSAKPLVLTLEHVGVAPVTIPVGGTYSWTPNVLDFGYTSSTGDFGIVNVGAFGN